MSKNGALVRFRSYSRLTARGLISDDSLRLWVGIGFYFGFRGAHAYAFGTNMGVSWDHLLCIPCDTPPFGGMIYGMASDLVGPLNSPSGVDVSEIPRPSWTLRGDNPTRRANPLRNNAIRYDYPTRWGVFRSGKLYTRQYISYM